MEEITLKAGNFKKFDVFLQMLASAFDNDSESVYVDVLTYSDLEMLKARKSAPGGDAESTTSTSVQSRSQTKRYVILTYRGEFDRVHYPLPLSYEDTPNADSLQRTIRRLRKRVQDADSVPQTDLVGEKDLRKIIANLRQENTELKHRIRRQGSGGNAKEEEHIAGLNRTIADLQSANGKQRKEIEGLKKELSKADATYQKYRTESQKEINKWKTKSMDPRRRNEVDSPLGESSTGADRSLTNSLRKRVAELERELRLEKLSSSRTGGYSGRSPASVTRGTSSSSVGPPRRAATPPMSRAYSRGTPTSAGSNRSYRGPGTFGTATRGRSQSPSTGGYRKPTVGSSNSTYRGNTPVTARSRSISPGFGSSVGGRFDPTAYQRAKEAKAAQSMANRAGYGASPGSGRRYGSQAGYDSQDSADYRSGQPSSRSRRVSSRPHSSPAASSISTRSKKKASGASNRSSVSSSVMNSGRAVDTSGEVRKDRKVRRGAEKSAKTTTLKNKKDPRDGSIGSFPLPVDDIPVSNGPGADLDGSLVEDSPPLSKSPANRGTLKASPGGSPNKSREDIQAIDARIASLQQYLESARVGLLSDEEHSRQHENTD